MIKSPVLGTHSYDAPSSHHPRTPFLRRKSRKENGNSRYVVTPTRATTAMRPRSRRLYTQRCTGGPESDDVNDDDADDGRSAVGRRAGPCVSWRGDRYRRHGSSWRRPTSAIRSLRTAGGRERNLSRRRRSRPVRREDRAGRELQYAPR